MDPKHVVGLQIKNIISHIFIYAIVMDPNGFI